MRRALACLAVCLALTAVPLATTVIPPTFQELVGEAELVFEGDVVDTRSRIDNTAGEDVIVTAVTFDVLRVLKGAANKTVVLEFLGGAVGDRGLKVAGMPVFARGDRDVIFAITSQRLISPLVRVMHGRVRISREGPAAQEFVHLHDGSLLRDVAALGIRPQESGFSQRPALTLRAFEAAVADEVSRQAAQKGPRR
jgi:hypothetical protein